MKKINPDNYMEHYQNFVSISEKYWANKDNPRYESDMWMNKNRNRIGLEMLDDICNGKSVLSIGGGAWVEGEFLSCIGSNEVMRTDLVLSNGVELLADGCNLPFKDESFDVVICREVVEHVLDPISLLTEAWRVLKPEGYYFITTPNVLNFPLTGEHLNGWSPCSFLAILEDAGFNAVKTKGDAPNLFRGLLTFADMGVLALLSEFKEIQEKVDTFTDSYYIGTFLYVLARKEI